MREIKFRAWDKEFNNMEPSQHMILMALDRTQDRYEIMQYTGLQDKNKKEIYEGDIVRYDNKYIGSVCFGNAAYAVRTSVKHIIDLKDWMNRDLEVIGNIWENKELLK